MARVTVSLPDCLARILSRVYDTSAAEAVRRFILDVLRGTPVYIPDELMAELERCIAEAG